MSTENTWYLWRDDDRPAAENMAIDDLLLQSMQQAQPQATLRFYGWSEPAYSIGYFQPYASAPQGEHRIVRRPSGGGVVDHRNDITFTLVFPASDPLFQCDRFESYRRINEAICNAFKSIDIDCILYDNDIPKDFDRSYLVCFEQPAKFDVITSRGKLCGGAQRRKLYGMLHQASILCDQLQGVSHETIIQSIIGSFSHSFDCDFAVFDNELQTLKDAMKLADSRYSTDAWNHKK